MSKADILEAARFTGWSLLMASGLLLLNVLMISDLSRTLSSQHSWYLPRRNMMFAGASIVFLSLSAKEVYWWVAEVGKDGSGNVYRVLAANSSWTAICYAGVIVGTIMLFSGWLESRCGRLWLPVAVGVVLLLSGMGLWL